MSINRASTQKAFTLIELLVAITILSMIFTILFTGLRTGVRTRDALETKTDRVENIHLVQNLLRRQLRQILPALIPDEDENDEDGGRIAFLGLEDRIVIVAPLANRMDFPGLQKLTLRIRDNSTADAVHKQLVLSFEQRLEPDRFTFSFDPEVPEFVILDGFEGAAFSYRSVTSSAGDSWTKEWNNSWTLPALIRLQLRSDPRSGGVWPDLIVAPRVAAHTASLNQNDG